MKIVGVAACTVGIAHTYMAQKAIQDECAARGIECKVEAQGGLGIENELTQEDVDSADLVLESVDVGVENEDRFEQKMAEGKGKGYERWAKIHNLKQAAKALQTAGIKKLPNITSLQAEYGQLQAQKETLCVDYGKLKKQVKEYAVIKRNIDSILRQDKEPEYNKEATRE